MKTASSATAGLRCLVVAAVLLLPSTVQAAVVTIAPHQATYKLSLANARSQSSVAGVDGSMTFTWADACDAWTIEQRFQVKFTYAEGEQVDLNTSYVTWESKDGRAYRFNVRKSTNGELDEELKGEASLDGDKGGTARYVLPEPHEVTLKPGTMFPTAHTLHLLSRGQPGLYVSAPVFDGAEAEGASDVGALLGRMVTPPPADVKGTDLLRAKAHRVYMAFFPTDSREPLPEYESNLTLLENGIVRAMQIDYGDFKVDVRLESLEAAPKPPC